MGRSFDIDPELAQARTPPAALYTDPAWHDEVVERVLRRGWHHLHAVASAPGATVVPLELAGRPLVWTSDGEERLLSNVCTHRGAVLVDAPCKVHALRCPYHGRRFRLDGTPTTAPGFPEVPVDEVLPAAVIARSGPWRWGAVQGPPAFGTWWGQLADRLPDYPFEALKYDPTEDRDHPIDVPWLVYVENYLEGLHIPFVHPELARTLDLASYRTELLPYGTVQRGLAAAGEPALELGGERVAALYFWLFPATMVNVYPGGVSLNLVEAAGHGRCVVRYRTWVRDASLRGRGAGGDLDLVEAQDQAVVRRAWAGMRSGAWRPARYSPTHEQGVHHFHRLLADALR